MTARCSKTAELEENTFQVPREYQLSSAGFIAFCTLADSSFSDPWKSSLGAGLILPPDDACAGKMGRRDFALALTF